MLWGSLAPNKASLNACRTVFSRQYTQEYCPGRVFDHMIPDVSGIKPWGSGQLGEEALTGRGAVSLVAREGLIGTRTLKIAP